MELGLNLGWSHLDILSYIYRDPVSTGSRGKHLGISFEESLLTYYVKGKYMKSIGHKTMGRER